MEDKNTTARATVIKSPVSLAHLAAEKRKAEVVRMLFEEGLDVTMKDKRGSTILHAAARGGCVDTVQVVLEACERQRVLQRMLTARDQYRGSEPCFLVRGHNKEQHAWHYVEADRGRMDIFRKKVQGGSVDVANYGTVKGSGWGTDLTQDVVLNGPDPNGPQDMQPLHVAILNNHEPVALLLISLMADVGEPDCIGLTPLHLTAKRGHNKAIEALLKKGAPHEVIDALGRTPLDIAVMNGQQKAVKLLKLHTQGPAIEDLRLRFQGVHHDLRLETLQQLVQDGGDPERYMTTKLREVHADISDFLHDVLHQSSIVTESGLATGGVPLTLHT